MKYCYLYNFLEGLQLSKRVHITLWEHDTICAAWAVRLEDISQSPMILSDMEVRKFEENGSIVKIELEFPRAEAVQVGSIMATLQELNKEVEVADWKDEVFPNAG